MAWRVRPATEAGEPPAALAILVGMFVGVRAFAYARGLRFDASEHAAFWHVIEPALLRDRLGESLLYLHAQPPLFNLWIGLYLKMFGDALPVAFAVTFTALGVMLCVQMLAVARALGISGWPRTLGVAVFCTSPAVLLYEQFLLYAYPVAVLLTWSAARFHRALERGRERDWYVFVGIALAIVLMRALYHPVWLVLLLAGAAWAATRCQGSARPLARPAVIAIAIVGAVLAKNVVLFGHATLSTFGGMNISRVVLDRMDASERSALVEESRLSPWALTGGFKPLSEYTPPPPTEPTGIPLLDRPFKDDGSVNFHHRAYIAIGSRLGQDALTGIREQPTRYLRSVWENAKQTLRPAWTYAPLAEARSTIAPLVRAYAPVLGWPSGLGGMGAWPVLLPALLLVTIGALWRDRSRADARGMLTAYMALTITYVCVVGALMERTENQRFRFDVDPMIWLLLLAVLQRAWTSVRERDVATGRC